MARGDGYAKGERHPQAKLCAEAIRFIRASGDTIGELARRFNVCKKTLRQAKAGRTWRHVEGQRKSPGEGG
jgi:transposase-like protein